VWRGSDRENIVSFYQSVRRVIGVHFLFHSLPRTMCVLNNICDIRVEKIIMVGHSAGGSAIRMAAYSGGLNFIRPNRLVYSDAGYGRWTDQTWKYYVKDHTSTQWVILVRKWDRPYRNTVRFFKRFRKIPENIVYRVFSRKTHGHGTIGDECLLWAYPTGR
jgi:pimeloyl-ACP methyl ester carboxylesterase